MDFNRMRKILTYWASALVLFVAVYLISEIATPPRRPEITPPVPHIEEPPPPPLKSPSLDKYSSEPTISVYVHETGGTIWLPMDDYIAGVIAAEMDPEWPLHALAAQAITARTVTIWSMENRGTPRQLHNTDACTSQFHLQVYNARRVNDHVREAVALTRGMILTYEGEPINAYYSSFSGGQSATLRESFPKAPEDLPYLVSVPSPTHEDIPANIRQWQVTIPLATLRNIAGWQAGYFDNVSVLERGPSGRITLLGMGNATITGADLRSRLGTSVLRSTLIDEVYTSGSSVVFIGRGWGNGIGLDQWGAYAMSEEGRTGEEIVRHFFQGVDVLTLWE